jgi:pimeloyl-ACP methyl ester carboxylesterase
MGVAVREVRVGDLSFQVAEEGPGDGVPALLLHGFPASLASWEPLLPRLAAAGLRTAAPNQRGYSPGARPQGEQNYRVDRLLDDVLDMLDALDMDRAHVIAHDWGAIVAWHLAARHPDRLHSLTALSVPHPAALGWALTHDPNQQEGSSYVSLLRISGKAEDVLLADGARRLRNMFDTEVPDHLVEAHVGLLSDRAALTGALSWYRAVGPRSRPWQEVFAQRFCQLPPVAVPTTYIRGARDTALGRAAAERCAEHVSGDYRYVELPDVGHWVPEQAPEIVEEAVLARL